MIQLERRRAIDIHTEATVAPPFLICPWVRGETLTTEGFHAVDECRSAIHNHHRS
ncbi:hypothetical protein DPMN_165859 [Dreissena polymorpha]|uniref:Uncharacterized protein n=1 Tax=Dreissena polymorpha TaxID=45954 RepID=A0A9D4IX24_DREPO|nr:hypothetical protein DPMN_165859 [Dreissena polymorpha]